MAAARWVAQTQQAAEARFAAPAVLPPQARSAFSQRAALLPAPVSSSPAGRALSALAALPASPGPPS